MTTPLTNGGRTLPGEADNFGVIFQEHPPFTTGDFVDVREKLKEWALRVERSLIHLGGKADAQEVSLGLAEDRMTLYAST